MIFIFGFIFLIVLIDWNTGQYLRRMTFMQTFIGVCFAMAMISLLY